VEQVGFMIADKQQGAFSLVVEEMTFVE